MASRSTDTIHGNVLLQRGRRVLTERTGAMAQGTLTPASLMSMSGHQLHLGFACADRGRCSNQSGRVTEGLAEQWLTANAGLPRAAERDRQH